VQIDKRFLWSLYRVCLLLTLTACGVRIQEFKSERAASYQHFSEINGLKASADIFTEEGRLETFFGDNLLKRGILPVLVVFENNRSKGGYVLLREQSKFAIKTDPKNGDSQGITTDVINNNPVNSPGSGTPRVLGAAPLIFGFPGAVAALATAFVVGINQSNREKVFHNIEEKQMVAKAVYPGESHSGFIYFKIKVAEVENIEGIILTVQNLKTQELEQLSISLK